MALLNAHPTHEITKSIIKAFPLRAPLDTRENGLCSSLGILKKAQQQKRKIIVRTILQTLGVGARLKFHLFIITIIGGFILYNPEASSCHAACLKEGYGCYDIFTGCCAQGGIACHQELGIQCTPYVCFGNSTNDGFTLCISCPSNVTSYITTPCPTPAPITPAPTTPTNLATTIFPSRIPSTQPSQRPSGLPSLLPTGTPSSEPTELPTLVPSMAPTDEPSGEPSNGPTVNPAITPSHSPSLLPSWFPTRLPSFLRPTAVPNAALPTALPSIEPTNPQPINPSAASSSPLSQSVQPSSTQPTGETDFPSSLPSFLPPSPEGVTYTPSAFAIGYGSPSTQSPWDSPTVQGAVGGVGAVLLVAVGYFVGKKLGWWGTENAKCKPCRKKTRHAAISDLEFSENPIPQSVQILSRSDADAIPSSLRRGYADDQINLPASQEGPWTKDNRSLPPLGISHPEDIMLRSEGGGAPSFSEARPPTYSQRSRNVPEAHAIDLPRPPRSRVGQVPNLEL